MNRSRSAWGGVVLLVAIVTIGSCAPPSPVVQGAVVSVTGTTVHVQDETQPQAEPIAIDVATAEMGAQPVVGHVVRIVYREEGNRRRALAVMDVTRERGTGRESR